MSLLSPVVGELVCDDSRWRGPMSKAPGDLRGLGDETHKTTGLMGGLGKTIGIVGGAMAAVGAVEFLGGAIDEYQEARKVGAQTNAVIKSTGGVAKVSAKEVGDLADSLSNKAAIDDEVIASGENMLLTFTNIRNEVGDGNDIFNQATKAALDMSVALGTDMTSEAMRLGKALNDPIGGITALRRAGVQFTDEQEKSIKTMVESGNVMGAQKMILAELTKEFGGSAEAQATGLDRLSVLWGNAKESVGGFAAKVIDAGINAVPKLLAPLQNLAQKAKPIWDELVGGVRAFGDAFDRADGDITSAGFAGWMEEQATKLRPQFDALKTSLGDTFTGIAQFLRDNEDTWREWSDAIGGVVQQMVGIWQSTFGLLVALVSVFVAVFQDIWDRYGEHLWQHIQTAFNAIIQVITGALQIIKGIIDFFTAVLTGDWGGAWDAIVEIVTGAWNIIVGVVELAVNSISNSIGMAMAVISAIWSFAWNAMSTLLADVWNGIIGIVSAAIGGLISLVSSIPGRILSALGDLGSLLYNAGRSVITGFLNGIKDSVGGVFSFVSGIAGTIAKLKGPLDKDRQLLVPAGQAIMGGLVGGLKSGEGPLVSQLNHTTGLITGVGGSTFAGGGGAATGGGTVIYHTTIVQLGDEEISRMTEVIRKQSHLEGEGVAGGYMA